MAQIKKYSAKCTYDVSGAVDSGDAGAITPAATSAPTAAPYAAESKPVKPNVGARAVNWVNPLRL